LHLDGNGILVPPDYGIAGWYAAGPEPGEGGVAIIAGHLDSKTGPDTFYNLGRVKVGGRVLVDLVDGTKLSFRIVSRHQYPVADFPASKVFRTTTNKPELRLITCAGTYDHAAGHYRDNLVIFADLVASPSTGSGG
jgi:sortase (surface protein transpeptidase)